MLYALPYLHAFSMCVHAVPAAKKVLRLPVLYVVGGQVDNVASSIGFFVNRVIGCVQTSP